MNIGIERESEHVTCDLRPGSRRVAGDGICGLFADFRVTLDGPDPSTVAVCSAHLASVVERALPEPD